MAQSLALRRRWAACQNDAGVLWFGRELPELARRDRPANTPVGTFTVEREIRGVRRAPLGTLINPKYFHRGFAIHGSPSVPPHPASHGCIRVTIADSEWMFDRLPIGTHVVVHGGTHVFIPSDPAA